MVAHRSAAQSRTQYGLFATPFEELIAVDNPVRVIDAFVNFLDLEKHGFLHVRTEKTGAPPFHPSVLLKLYFYGYFNRIRSSRRLEAECGRNIELMWLLAGQKPAYRTIAAFRSDKAHGEALKAVFRQLVAFCRGEDLIGGEIVAIDGTKIRAQNSMKRNFNADKLERQVGYNEKKFDEYIAQLDAGDLEPDAADAILEKAENALKRLENHKNLQKQLEESGQTQVSLTDPDARALPIHMGIVQVAYNAQSVVDDRQKLIVHLEMTNEKDTNALAALARTTAEILENSSFTVLADKGYHQGKMLHECHEMGLTTCVAPLEYAPAAAAKEEPKFQKEDFVFDEKTDTYACPAGQKLATNGSTHERKGPKGELMYTFQRYSIDTATCAKCPLKAKCLSSAHLKSRHKKHIDRNGFDHAIERNRRFVNDHKELYRRRQALVEHPFGTIKRAWGNYFTLLKGLPKVSAEFQIVGATYNLRRLVSIFGANELVLRLNGAFLGFLAPRRAWAATVAGCFLFFCHAPGRRSVGIFIFVQ